MRGVQAFEYFGNRRRPPGNTKPRKEKTGMMELLIPIALIAVWILLQVWLLPKMGFRT